MYEIYTIDYIGIILKRITQIKPDWYSNIHIHNGSKSKSDALKFHDTFKCKIPATKRR